MSREREVLLKRGSESDNEETEFVCGGFIGGGNNGPPRCRVVARTNHILGDHNCHLSLKSHIKKYTTVYRYGHRRSVNVASGKMQHPEGLHVAEAVLEALA
jgi:hypothetical protein